MGDVYDLEKNLLDDRDPVAIIRKSDAMPTVECRCNVCGHVFAQLTFQGDAVAPACPRCKQKDVHKKSQQERFMTGPGMGAHLTGVPKGPS